LRIYNRYVLWLLLAVSSINILLAFLNTKDLTNYFIIHVIAYLVITLLFTYLNPRARRALNTISAALFAGFMIVVILKVMDILSGR
jgi:TRAP-type C4-dicarboxylate transport system permease small subunit